ncbi:hypothetical protein KAR91_36095 [Candidatus Pacearchaeota archaeon]|nr:hypothetical protein [Candidatus Pacearchaeota archaeon]
MTAATIYTSKTNNYIQNPGLMIADGHLENMSVVHKFGRNTAVGTTLVPVTVGGIFRTPQVGSATQLRVKAGNAGDTIAGAGAREIQIQGIDVTGSLVTEAIPTAGASAGANSVNSYIRLLRAFVCESGTYATQSAGSHIADVVIENAAGTEDWATIELNSYARSQTEIAAYTVPFGKVAFLNRLHTAVDTNFAADVIMFRREGVLKTVAPYDANRVILELKEITGQGSLENSSPMGPFPAFTDLLVLAKVAVGTAEVAVDFELILVDNNQ